VYWALARGIPNNNDNIVIIDDFPNNMANNKTITVLASDTNNDKSILNPTVIKNNPSNNPRNGAISAST